MKKVIIMHTIYISNSINDAIPINANKGFTFFLLYNAPSINA